MSILTRKETFCLLGSLGEMDSGALGSMEEVLVRLTRSTSPLIRREACLLLGRGGIGGEALVRLLGDGNTAVREYAAEALGMKPLAPEAREALLRLSAEDPAGKVRAAAIRSLANGWGRRAPKALHRIICQELLPGERSALVRLACYESMCLLDPGCAFHNILALYKNAGVKVKSGILDALFLLLSPENADEIHDFLQSLLPEKEAFMVQASHHNLQAALERVRD